MVHCSSPLALPVVPAASASVWSRISATRPIQNHQTNSASASDGEAPCSLLNGTAPCTPKKLQLLPGKNSPGPPPPNAPTARHVAPVPRPDPRGIASRGRIDPAGRGSTQNGKLKRGRGGLHNNGNRDPVGVGQAPAPPRRAHTFFRSRAPHSPGACGRARANLGAGPGLAPGSARRPSKEPSSWPRGRDARNPSALKPA